MYSILKLHVHWLGDGVLDDKIENMADWVNTATGVFVQSSKFKQSRGDVFLAGRAVPVGIMEAFTAKQGGGYAAAAVAANNHTSACANENCGK